jgi:putative addiction module component (TIGR02574 family)
MTGDEQELMSAALRLPERKRAELAESLLASLEGEVGPAEAAVIDAAWDAEIQRRVRAFDAGKVELVPWEVVQARQRRTW